MGGHPRIGGVEVEIQRVLRGIEVQDCKDEGLVRWLAMGGLAMSVRAGAWGGEVVVVVVGEPRWGVWYTIRRGLTEQRGCVGMGGI